MKSHKDEMKTIFKSKERADSNDREPAGNINNMTIEEARKAEKAFNEELEIFKEAARMNRKLKEE